MTLDDARCVWPGNATHAGPSAPTRQHLTRHMSNTLKPLYGVCYNPRSCPPINPL